MFLDLLYVYLCILYTVYWFIFSSRDIPRFQQKLHSVFLPKFRCVGATVESREIGGWTHVEMWRSNTQPDDQQQTESRNPSEQRPNVKGQRRKVNPFNIPISSMYDPYIQVHFEAKRFAFAPPLQPIAHQRAIFGQVSIVLHAAAQLDFPSRKELFEKLLECPGNTRSWGKTWLSWEILGTPEEHASFATCVALRCSHKHHAS